MHFDLTRPAVKGSANLYIGEFSKTPWAEGRFFNICTWPLCFLFLAEILAEFQGEVLAIPLVFFDFCKFWKCTHGFGLIMEMHPRIPKKERIVFVFSSSPSSFLVAAPQGDCAAIEDVSELVGECTHGFRRQFPDSSFFSSSSSWAKGEFHM